MPRIADDLLDGIAFLYRTADEARARVRLGGSAFLLGRSIPGTERLFGKRQFLVFIVSNRHVVFEGSACVASINRRDDGEPEILEIDQNEWHAHPDGDDLAAACIVDYIDSSIHRATFVDEDQLITEALAARHDVGAGDDVFMLGRFVNHQGDRVNQPAVRFGNISVPPRPIRTTGPGGQVREQLSYAVEMRSRTGFSGAPVVMYRGRGATLTQAPENSEAIWGLLGVNWGYIKDEYGENTFLNGVVPAWKILELLESPPLRAIFDKHIADVAALIAETESG